MKTLITAFSVALALAWSFPAYSQTPPNPDKCYTVEEVVDLEAEGKITTVPMSKDATEALIKALIAEFKWSPWSADHAIVFTNGSRTKIVYFVDGCATIETNVPTPTFFKITGKPA